MSNHEYIFFKENITDVEQIPEVLPDMRSRILQYSRGKLTGQIISLELPELTIYRYSANQGLQVEQAPLADWFSVVIFDYVSGAFNWMGQALDTEAILLLPPDEAAQYCAPLSWSGIELFLETSLQKKLGLVSKENGKSLRYSKICQIKVSGNNRKALANKGKQLLQMAQQGHPDLDNAITRLQHTEQLIELLQTTLQSTEDCPSILLNTSDAQKLIKRAQALIEQGIHLGQKLSIPDLAHSLDTHERVLYKAFQENLGISPYRWNHLIRMHQFRQQAVKLSQSHGAVTTIAMEMGFNNLSHFSEQFKRHFGESPRQFLHRCKIPQ